MKNDFTARKLSLYYARVKDTTLFHAGVFALIILVCIFLLWFVIVPEVQQYAEDRQKVEETKEKIAILKKNIVFMQQQPNSELDKNLEISFAALPTQKDYIGILQSLALSSANAGVVLGDYDLSVGNVSEKSVTEPLTLALEVTGDNDSVTRFISEIQQKLPLTQSNKLTKEAEEGKIDMIFHNKAYPEIVYDDFSPLVPLSSDQKALLQKIESWKEDYSLLDLVQASGAAALSEEPF